MYEGYRAWVALKCAEQSRNGDKGQKCLYEGVIVRATSYEAEARRLRSAERRKLNVLEMKSLRSLVGASRMDKVRNNEVRRRAGI